MTRRAKSLALTVTRVLVGSPLTATTVAGSTDLASGGGGWAWVLSDLEARLVTGKPMAA
jgi:hypothetical protein